MSKVCTFNGLPLEPGANMYAPDSLLEELYLIISVLMSISTFCSLYVSFDGIKVVS